MWGQVCVAIAEKQPEIDMADPRLNAKLPSEVYPTGRASFSLLRLASGSGVGSKTRQTRSKMAAVERRQRGLALTVMIEAFFFDLEEVATVPKKKKRSVWVKPFLLRRNDPTCDAMFTIQREFLAVSANVKSRLLAFLRRK